MRRATTQTIVSHAHALEHIGNLAVASTYFQPAGLLMGVRCILYTGLKLILDTASAFKSFTRICEKLFKACQSQEREPCQSVVSEQDSR